ncbi:MAG: hypothetical protein AAB767_00565 [Patescibacteria group bacterium]
MITRTERMLLSLKEPPEGIIGFDCNGKHIHEGDTVEVKKENEIRKRYDREFSYCGAGKKGIASRHSCFPIGWTVTVKFDGENKDKIAGCTDYYLRIAPKGATGK